MGTVPVSLMLSVIGNEVYSTHIISFLFAPIPRCMQDKYYNRNISVKFRIIWQILKDSIFKLRQFGYTKFQRWFYK